MPGIRRTAALGAAFLFLVLAGQSVRADSPPHVLAPGAQVVFVTDAPIDPHRRDGDVVSVHLRNDFTFEGTVLAAAGTKAQVVYGRRVSSGGSDTQVIALDRFFINAGLMPVRAIEPIVPPLPAGAEITARTLAEVDRIGDRWSIRIPFPFRLSGDQPASAYTPTPARTASPQSMLRRPTPAPSPSAAPSATPSP